MPNYKILQYAALVVTLTLVIGIAYANSLTVPFQFDDYPVIVSNRALRAFAWIPLFYAQPSRIIVFLTFAANYAQSGFSASSYHLANIFIHVVNTALVIWLVTLLCRLPRLTPKPASMVDPVLLRAALAASLFATHPIQTQAVTYIWQRTAALGALFYLLSLSAYLASRLATAKARVRLWTGITIGSALLGMFTKENTYTIPLACFALEAFVVNGKVPWRERFSTFFKQYGVWFAGLWLTVGVVMLLAGNTQWSDIQDAKAGARHIDSWHYFLTQIEVLPRYIRLLFDPSGLCLDHDIPFITSLGDSRLLKPGLFLVALASAGAVLWRHRPLVTVGIAFFFLAHAVESSFIPLADPMFDHRMYLPLVGIALAFADLLSAAVTALFTRRAPKAENLASKLAPMILALAFLPLAEATADRNEVWQTTLGVWQDSFAKNPLSVRAAQNLGSAYFMNGKFSDAAAVYDQAIKLDQGNALLHFLRGLAYYSDHDSAKAAAAFAPLADLVPNSRLHLFSAALLRIDAKDNAGAEALLKQALSLPEEQNATNQSLAHVLLTALIEQKNYGEALTVVERLLEAEPGNPDYLWKRGEIKRQLGDLILAMADFEASLKTADWTADRWRVYGETALAVGDVPRAQHAAARALTLDPANAENVALKAKLESGAK